jgi:hypothetical protein
MLPTAPLQAEEALTTLHELMQSSESDGDRIRAAKILLDRSAPKKDDDAEKHEADERDAALAEARGLLAEFAVIKLAFFRLKNEMAREGEAAADNPAG